MAYFPFFVDLDGKRGLIVGGGTVALRKVEKLLPYGPRLTVVAAEVRDQFFGIPGVTILRTPFTEELLEEADFVIAATDDKGLNHRVAHLCRERNIPVNVVDDREACTFLFPALVKRGDLSVGISTGGTSPTAAIYLKNRIRDLLPQGFERILAFLDTVREEVRETVPVETERSQFFARLFEACMEKGEPLSPEELRTMLDNFPVKRGDPE